jgi:hypothetical protein
MKKKARPNNVAEIVQALEYFKSELSKDLNHNASIRTLLAENEEVLRRRLLYQVSEGRLGEK